MSTKHRLPGIAQWFRFNERTLVEKTARILNDLEIPEMRILFSWADWEREGGPEWFDFFVKVICTQTATRLIPALYYTPPHLAEPNKHGETKTSHPPRNLSDFANFVNGIIVRYGQYFDWLQIWNEPNWKPYWEWDLDPEGKKFAEMAEQAIKVIHGHNKKAALGGLSPYEYDWITLMDKHGLLKSVDAIGIHYSPSWKDQRQRWFGWHTQIETVRAHLKGLGRNPEIWIAEAGYSTASEAEEESKRLQYEQIKFFDETRNAPADKILWYSVFDQFRDHETDNVINMAGRVEEAAYGFGLLTQEELKKPLYLHWKNLLGESAENVIEESENRLKNRTKFEL